MLNFAIPVIEQMPTNSLYHVDHDISKQIRDRYEIANIVTNYFHGVATSGEYYSALSKLLSMEDYERVLLYLPLSDLYEAPRNFKDAYLRAWYRLLHQHNARENFFEGDTYEFDARPNGEVERIVKCVHLVPWLLEARYIYYSDIKRILELGHEDEILLQSFTETWRIIGDRNLLSKTQLDDLQELTANVPPRKRLEPLFISEGRKKWLSEKEQEPDELVTPDANLAGPFSQNLDALWDELERIQSDLEPDEIALVAGSRLKGYGTKTSDWDVFKLKVLESDPSMSPGNPRGAFVYFNALWLGGDKVNNLPGIAASKAKEYFGRNDRKTSIERIEIDLLQYRLLHKGFQRFYSGFDSAASGYPEIDGNCPFYDDEYRRIATELYAKYVFIPQKN